MHANQRARMSCLEKLLPRHGGAALIVVHSSTRNENEIVGISGLNMPRLAHEDADTYLARLESDIRNLRGNNRPFIGFAEYLGDA